jgi:hypothetical protein
MGASGEFRLAHMRVGVGADERYVCASPSIYNPAMARISMLSISTYSPRKAK